MSLIEFERGKMWGNSESSPDASDNSLTIAENWVFGALIVTSTMPLEREILASFRTFDASGLLLLVRVSENLLMATTRVLMLASFPLSCWTWGWMNSAREWKFMSFILRHLVDRVVSGQNLPYGFWDADAVAVNCQKALLPMPSCNIS